MLLYYYRINGMRRVLAHHFKPEKMTWISYKNRQRPTSSFTANYQTLAKTSSHIAQSNDTQINLFTQ